MRLVAYKNKQYRGVNRPSISKVKGIILTDNNLINSLSCFPAFFSSNLGSTINANVFSYAVKEKIIQSYEHTVIYIGDNSGIKTTGFVALFSITFLLFEMNAISRIRCVYTSAIC